MSLWNSYLLALLLLLTGCNECPKDIKWDRDTCERCRMIISDKHFAVLVCAKNQNYVFDDLGCALHWLKKQPWGEETKIWVADYHNGQWLDARSAYYVPGQISPMDYGFGAVPVPEAGSVDFETAKAQILAKGHKAHSPLP